MRNAKFFEQGLDKFSDKIKGTISGFDRIVIKGIFKNLNYVEGMFSFLLSQKVLLKDFGEYVQNKANEFKEKSLHYISYRNIEDIISKADVYGKEAVQSALQSIKHQLSENTFPH